MQDRTSNRRGFTLIEVTISIGIVLLLVAGINLIFSIASKAVGAGQTLNEHSRSNMAAQAVMAEDFRHCATDDSPYLIIYSHALPAFRNIDDMRSDPTFNAADTNPDTRGQGILQQDFDGSGTVGDSPGEITSPVTVNNRNHRTDILEFFSRGRNDRRTGNPGTYASSGYSNESLIWYGHLALPDNSGTFLAGGVPKTSPGQGTFGANNNPNNVFASQWALGRESILLSEADSTGRITDASGDAQSHIYDSNNWRPTDGVPANLWPLQFGSPAQIWKSPDDSVNASALQYGRFDLADTNFEYFRQRLRRYTDANPATNWWSPLMASDYYRFYADPLISKPLTSVEYAKTSPIFLNSCSQFIVEFAGDFVKQGTVANPDSDQVTANGGDGVIDYFDKYVNGATPPVRQIRWYGFPRNTDTSNDGPGVQRILGQRALSAPYFTADIDSRTDVVPVRDITPLGTTAGTVPFERTIAGDPADPSNSHNILNKFTSAPADWETATNSAVPSPSSYYYLCAWGPDTDAAGINRPSLIRITYTLDDPTGRIATGSTFEYIFKVK